MKDLMTGKKVPFSTIVFSTLDAAVDKHLHETGQTRTEFVNQSLAEKLEREGSANARPPKDSQ